MQIPWDYVASTMISILAGVFIGLFSFGVTERLRKRTERKNVANTLLNELSLIKHTLIRKEPYKARTLAFDALVPKISLFHPDTIYALLFTYNDLHFMLRSDSSWADKDFERLNVNIKSAIMILERETKRRL